MIMATFMTYVLLPVLISGVTSLSLQEVNTEWHTFKFKFNRTYASKREEYYRYSVFTENVKSIYTHNMAADEGRYSYWLGINNFADMTSNEFNNKYANLKINPSAIRRHSYAENRTKHGVQELTLPEEVDWRVRSCVTPVKNQGNCGGCYAFAATGALEGQKCIKYGTLTSLSEQNIIDCSFNYGNDGCKAGMPDNAFKYAVGNVIDTEQTYPYRGAIGRCSPLKGSFGVKASDYRDILPHGNVYKLKEAVAKIGPISVCIDTRGEENKFQHYRNGIYDNRECGKANPTHALLVVGYGRDIKSGNDYWIIKNSYGTCWGIDGYMLMARNGKNTCGIATHASYPVV